MQRHQVFAFCVCSLPQQILSPSGRHQIQADPKHLVLSNIIIAVFDEIALCRCVDGTGLNHCVNLLPVGDSTVNLKQREQLVLEIAVKLLQVL